MNHNYSKAGINYKIRPVSLNDCDFILELRCDPELSRFINTTENSIVKQRAWLTSYLNCDNDYYFIIENLKTGLMEGTVGVYDIDRKLNTGEWGRWILKKNSPAAIESAMLIYKYIFEELCLDSVYCRTLEMNVKVVNFHTSCGLRTDKKLLDYVLINGSSYDAIQQILTLDEWPDVNNKLQNLANLLNRRA